MQNTQEIKHFTIKKRVTTNTINQILNLTFFAQNRQNKSTQKSQNSNQNNTLAETLSRKQQ